MGQDARIIKDARKIKETREIIKKGEGQEDKAQKAEGESLGRWGTAGRPYRTAQVIARLTGVEAQAPAASSLPDQADLALRQRRRKAAALPQPRGRILLPRRPLLGDSDGGARGNLAPQGIVRGCKHRVGACPVVGCCARRSSSWHRGSS